MLAKHRPSGLVIRSQPKCVASIVTASSSSKDHVAPLVHHVAGMHTPRTTLVATTSRAAGDRCSALQPCPGCRSSRPSSAGFRGAVLPRGPRRLCRNPRQIQPGSVGRQHDGSAGRHPWLRLQRQGPQRQSAERRPDAGAPCMRLLYDTRPFHVTECQLFQRQADWRAVCARPCGGCQPDGCRPHRHKLLRHRV